MEIIRHDRKSYYLKTHYADGTLEDGTEFTVAHNINMGSIIITFPEAIYTVSTQVIITEVIDARSPKLRLVEIDAVPNLLLDAHGTVHNIGGADHDSKCERCASELEENQDCYVITTTDRYICMECVVVVALEGLFSVPGQRAREAMKVKSVPLTSSQSDVCKTVLARVIEMSEGAVIVDDSLSGMVVEGFKVLYIEEACKLPEDFCLEVDNNGNTR